MPRFVEPPCILDRRQPVQTDWLWFLSDLGYRREDVRNSSSRITLACGIASYRA
ncbi:hypothetical protein [Bradyrhizobium pachyrhizi]|uniref:hypothetical protein n=1 Tax=Bradyrhizobium pachyrhizi TaxID=280333 RepID=UPI003D368497